MINTIQNYGTNNIGSQLHLSQIKQNRQNPSFTEHMSKEDGKFNRFFAGLFSTICFAAGCLLFYKGITSELNINFHNINLEGFTRGLNNNNSMLALKSIGLNEKSSPGWQYFAGPLLFIPAFRFLWRSVKLGRAIEIAEKERNNYITL